MFVILPRSGSENFFCAHSARPLRKLKNHVLLWIRFILNCKGKVCLQQSATFCLSNVDNFLPDLGTTPFMVYQILNHNKIDSAN